MRSAALYTPEQHERQNLGFTVTTDGERCVVAVHTKINALNARPIRNRVNDELLAGNIRSVVIDLSHADDIDARGFAELVAITADAKRYRADVVIVNPSEDLRALFDHHAIAKLFTFAPSEGTP